MPRTPKHFLEVVCENEVCPRKGKPFRTARNTARYCGDPCRRQAAHLRKVPRLEVLERDNNQCTRCSWDSGRLYVRWQKGPKDKASSYITLCASCHMRESIKTKVSTSVKESAVHTVRNRQ